MHVSELRDFTAPPAGAVRQYRTNASLGASAGAEKEKADQNCKAGLRLAVRVLIGLSVQGPVRS
jgi:hypothetical protein